MSSVADQSEETLVPFSSSIGRRKFLTYTGATIIGTGMASVVPLTSMAQSESDNEIKLAQDSSPIVFPSITDPSERPMGKVPTPQNPKKRTGYAVVGLGRLSLYHILPALAKSGTSKLVALVSGDPEKAKKVGQHYGISEKNLYSYNTFDEIKNNSEIEAVYIVLPNSMHEEFTIRAAKAGKHVLCEKPMATSSESARRMIKAVKEAGKKLMIAYRIQYEPKNRQVMEWVRSKKYGNVKVIDSMNSQNVGDPSQWRLKKKLSGGGSLPDIGIYNLNTVRFLLGEEPVKVLASTFTTPNDARFTEVEEAVMFQLFFGSGVIANNTCSYGVHESRYYTCHTDQGATFGMSPAFSYGDLAMNVSEVKDKLEFVSKPTFGEDKDQFMLEVDHFSDCIVKNKTPYTPGEEGLQDQLIMEAIYESASTGKAINIPGVQGKDQFRGEAPAANE